MEKVGAEKIFKHSASKHSLYCISFYCDRDSKAFPAVKNAFDLEKPLKKVFERKKDVKGLKDAKIDTPQKYSVMLYVKTLGTLTK